MNALREKSKRRIYLKMKLWKQLKPDSRAKHNATYYQKNSAAIAEKKKVKYVKAKEEKKIKDHERSMVMLKGLFESSKKYRQKDPRECNEVRKTSFDRSVPPLIQKLRALGIDQNTDETFREFEKEANITFEMFAAKINEAKLKSDVEVVFEDPCHEKKLELIYKDIDRPSITKVWDKLHKKHFDFIEMVTKSLGVDFVCPGCFRNSDGKICRLCWRCQGNKKSKIVKSTLARKRKPITFTMADLENEKDDDEEFKLKVRPMFEKKTLPSRKCTRNIIYDDEDQD